MNDIKFIETLKQKRNACDYSQSRLAQELQISRQNLNEIDENNNKKYTIAMKNVHMYDYLLAIKDETHIYKAIIEAVPDENDSMMIWLDDFNFPQAEIEDIKKEIELYFKARNITCIFKAGKRA